MLSSTAGLRFWLGFLTARRIRVYPAVAVGATSAVAFLLTLSSSRAWWAVWGADFRAFYTGGAFVRAHRADLLYDVAAEAAFQFQALAGQAGGQVSAWLLPPFAAFAFVPLSRLSFSSALIIHSAMGLAAAASALVLLERELGRPRLRPMAWAAMTYYPSLQWFSEGQLTSLSLLLFAAAFVLLRRGNDSLAGAVIGCLAYKPQLAVGLVAALVGARRFRFLGFALATALGWASLSYLKLPGATREYIESIPDFDTFLRQDGYPNAGLHSLFQMSTLLLDALSRPAATAVGVALTALAIAALVALWARAPWAPGRPDWDRRMAATLALSVVASPHLFGYDLMLLLLPFFIVWHLYSDGTGGRPLDGGPLLAVSAIVWAFGLLGPALTVGQQTLTRWAFGRPFALQVGVVAILGWAWLVASAKLLPPVAAARGPEPFKRPHGPGV